MSQAGAAAREVKPSPLKKFAVNLLVLIVSVAATLVCAEVGLRIAHIGYPSLAGRRIFYTSDPYTGVRLRPGAEGLAHTDNEMFVRINSQGQHDREHARQKPANTYRIAVLGDSFVEAMQEPVEKSFSSILEKQLGSCAGLKGKSVEAINFGVAGYGTAQELQMLRHYAWDYSPDLVLLAFFTGNDIKNNARELEGDPYRPYFVHQNRKLVLDDSFLRAPGFLAQFDRYRMFLSWAGMHSHLVQVMSAARNYLATRNVGGETQAEMGLGDAIYQPPTDPVLRESWSVTEDMITTMRDEVRAKGAELLVVILTTGLQVDPDSAAREQLEKRLGVPNLSYPDDRISEFAKREGIPVLALAPPFLQYAREHHAQLHGFHGVSQGHWNDAGHRLGGVLMAHKICEMLSLAPLPAAVSAGGTPAAAKKGSSGAEVSPHP